MPDDEAVELARRLCPCEFCNGRGTERWAESTGATSFTDDHCRYCLGAGHFHDTAALATIRAAIAAAEARALERAAVVCDEAAAEAYPNSEAQDLAHDCAAAIRSLKPA